ncbi:MAG: histidinol dehydrogenase, partial [Chloroflexi bacterium]|nr:histidinol dehydrogenase [Chloroflexota bacterium]
MNINKINGFTSLKEKLNRRKQDYFFTPEVAVKEQAVREIVFDVKARGDKAVKEYTLLFDKVSLKSLEVSKQQIKQAFKQVDNDLLKAMQKAYERIKKYHQKQLAGLKKAIQDMGGVQKLLPVDVAAVYAPGGRAFYPSSVLMTATLARVAGVKEVILLTPPSDNGGVTAVTLAAASIAGVDRVFAVGGAQGIAAVAFGTESLPKADVICGPGNIYVTLAKKAVYGAVNIDGLQGPSEAMIIADQTADAVLVASEILAQAEHDPLAQSVFITTSDSYYEQVME